MIRTSLVEADEGDVQAMAPPDTSPVRNFLLGTLPISVVVFLLIYAVSRSWPIASTIAAGLMATSIVSNVRFFRKVASRRHEPRGGRTVEAIDVEASRVFDVEPLGSHGPPYVFFAEDGKALLLIGQWQLEQPSFPAASFRLRLWADTRKPIRIEVRGPEITPEQSRVRVPDGVRKRDVWLIDATPDTLAEDLRRAFG